MWYLWLIFALLAVLIPVWILLMASKAAKPYSNDKQKMKIISLNAIKYILFYWLCDLFFMSCIIDSLACKYIFGGSIMLIVFYNLSNAFANSKVKRSGLIKWGMLQDFIVGVGLSIYLIYIIPNTDLREIVSVIIAAVYGGLLTLVGVAWTIKHSMIQKHEDELVKAKPLFTFNFFAEKEPLVNNRKVCLVDSNKQPTTFAEALRRPNGTESFMEIENSEQSSFTIKRFYFDGAWHGVSANNVVLPNTRLLVQLFREDTVTHPIMEIEDIFKRKFYYDLMFQFLLFPNEKITDKHKSTLGQMKEITEQDVVERGIKIGESTNE